MTFYKVEQVLSDVSVRFNPSYESIVRVDPKARYEIRYLDGNLHEASLELFLLMLEERGFVELIEFPRANDRKKFYRFIVTKAYVC